MPSFLDMFVSLIKRPVEERQDSEVKEYIAWLRNKFDCLKALQPEFVVDVVKNCTHKRYNHDDVFIKQGERGNELFLFLRGGATVYVLQESDEPLQLVEAAIVRKTQTKDWRSKLGTQVWVVKENMTVGEVALAKANQSDVRTASVVADEETDVMVVNRELYARTVADFIELEFRQKTEFVERNPLFRHWAAKQRKQLIIGLKKETVTYGSRMAKQGQVATDMFFILSGEVEIDLDPAAYKTEFPRQWSELATLLPGMLDEDNSVIRSPHEALKERKFGHKRHQICLLGENEEVGALEMILGLENYIESATATSTCELLVLKKSQFDRMFRRKFASQTVDKMKENMASRLCLFIHQLTPRDAVFLKFLNITIEDPSLLKSLKDSKRRFSNGGLKSSSIVQDEEEEVPQHVRDLRKKLHMRPDVSTSLPGQDTTQVVLSNMNKRMQVFRERSGLNHINGFRQKNGFKNEFNGLNGNSVTLLEV